MFEISKLEFRKWLDTQSIEEMSPYEKTIVGIIITHFDKIAECGTANGARAQLMGHYIEELNNQTIEIPPTLDGTNLKRNKVKRLCSLSIENFRGFGAEEEFDFKKQYTFYHGPNGSGKTSLCEAIEYSVLGTIAEASSRSIPLDKYIIHSDRKNAAKPLLKCEFADGHEGIFPTSFSDYRFAFIERNRIIDFSHMGAATARVQAGRISALFGLTEFQTFVHEFTDSFDKRYLTLESDELKEFRDEQKNVNEDDAKQKALQKRVNKLSKELQDLVDGLGKDNIKTAEEAITFLSPAEGMIAEAIKQEREKHMESIDLGAIDELKNGTKVFLSALNDIQTDNKEILSDVASVNLVKLYNVVSALKSTYHEKVCPACRTPLEKTVKNPFEFAEDEVKKYHRISSAKERIKENSKSAAQSIQRIKLLLSRKEIKGLLTGLETAEICSASEQVADYLSVDIGKSKLIEQVNQVHDFLDNDKLPAEIKAYNQSADKNNKKYKQATKKLTEVYDNILNKQKELSDYTEQNDTISNTLKKKKQQLEDKKEWADTLSERISFNTQMVDAYKSIRHKLVKYVFSLPYRMAENLSKKACEYYNCINKGDADFELMEHLELPVAISDKIMVKMRDGISLDALQILSEGHMRILGLSILLAKAVSEGMPFLVFDDIVNSIDDDHRDGVASLLITHPDLQDTQMILTCHGELFVTLLEQYVPDKSKMERYMFLPADTLKERGVVIKYQDSALPLRVAREKFENGELKDAAAKCRQAVELISGKLWKKITDLGGTISVPLKRIDGRPDLYNIVSGLIKATKKKPLDSEEIHDLLAELQTQKYWNLLNKGTHVDQSIPEFNRGEVKELLQLVEKLSDCVNKIKITIGTVY